MPQTVSFEDAWGAVPKETISFEDAMSLPPTGVTIAPKGGTPRMASPEEAQPYRRANLLPLALNQNTGSAELALPEFAEKLLTAPGRAYSGELPMQSPDPITGEVHTSPQAIEEATNFAAVSPMAPGRGAMIAAAPQRALKSTAPSRNTIPTTQELGDMARIAYQRADEAGLAVKPESFKRIVGSIYNEVRKEGLDRTIHPKANAAAERLAEALSDPNPKTLQQLDTLRRVIKAAASSNEPDERRIASIMIDRVDDYLSNLTAKDVAAGDAAVASNSIMEARSLWARMRKAETIDELFERAQNAVGANYTQAGLATALRQQFRSLANNKKRLRGFTKEEQAAIRRVVRGGPVENFLRLVGKMAPRGVVSGGFNLGVGAALGPVAGGTTMLAGELARRGSARMTTKSANKASEIVRRGY